MKFIYIIFFIFLSNLVLANETNKIGKEIENTELETFELFKENDLDDLIVQEPKDEVILENENSLKEDILEETDNKISEKIISNSNTLEKFDLNKLKNYFNYIKYINSKTLQNHFISTLETVQFDLKNEKDKELLFLITNYLNSVGQLNKSFKIIENYQLNEEENYNFYSSIKINYLLSKTKLEEACNYHEEVTGSIKFDNSFLSKLDIFCQLLNNNLSAANLLNSVLLEEETKSGKIDEYFQLLVLQIQDPSEQTKNQILNVNAEINSELIFLYSAMARMADLPINKKLYEIDKKNLAIPIILNKSVPDDLRIKIANESYLENIISIESLSAIYMSIEFTSEQFNTLDQEIELISKDVHLNMAFLYRLANTQIFPSERMKSLINFWDYAKKNNLKTIAYQLSLNILESIDFSEENSALAAEIASAYIYNSNFEKAVEWIEFYENTNQEDSKSVYVRVLLDLYSINDLDSFINSISLTLNDYTKEEDNDNAELFYVLKAVMNLDIVSDTNINFNKIFDERSMPSIFLFNAIKNSIINNDDDKFLYYSLISMNEKQWNNLHPEHLKLILSGYLKYNNGTLFRDLILEIFKSYKFII